MQAYFNNNVCKRLHCENGVLLGHLLDEEDDDDEAGVFFNVMRWIIALLVLAAILLYGERCCGVDLMIWSVIYILYC